MIIVLIDLTHTFFTGHWGSDSLCHYQILAKEIFFVSLQAAINLVESITKTFEKKKKKQENREAGAKKLQV